MDHNITKHIILNVPSQDASRLDIDVSVETRVCNALQMLGSVLLMTAGGTKRLCTDSYRDNYGMTH